MTTIAIATAPAATLLREVRLTRGMTLAQLAQKVGVDESTISRWERGLTRRFDPRHVAALAEALHLSPTEALRLLDPTWRGGSQRDHNGDPRDRNGDRPGS